MKLLPLILCTGLVVAANFLTAAAADAYPETATPQNSTVREVTRAFLLDRIYGGWAGMLIGGLEGLPHEFKYNEQPRATLPEFTFLEPGARSDDDNDFEWTHLWHMDKEGVLKLPYPRLVEIWKTNMNQGIWVANKRARELMDQGLVPPATGSPSFNPHAGYNLSGQFCVEAYGMIAPGMPQTAAELGLHYARIAVSEEPLQATRFWTSLISLMAFHEGPLETAFEAALAAVDPASAMAEVATDARRLHREHPQDWKTARQAIHEKWVKQKKWNMNSTPSNGALVLLALLYGEGDFYPTLQYAMALGYDADCNAATAGAVLGTRLGFRHLAALPQFRMPDRYLNKTRPSLPVECKVSEQAETLMRVCERVILAHGGERIEVDGQPGYRVRLQAVRLNHPWEVIEMAFEARGDLANPYVDGLPEGQVPMARATFTGASGPAQGLRHTLALFWDGAKTWKVRFAPPAAGEWTWSITSNNPGLDGTSGTFQVVDWTETEKQANPARRGFIRVHQGGERAGRYFEYADGTPFLWIGDTWWNWTKRGIQFSSFQRLADDRAAKGFTVGQLFFSPNGLLNRNFDTPNLEQIRKVEQMIAYANRQGITVWIHPWWSRERLNERVSPEQMRRWWRYVIARLGAYNTLWVLAGEYNMHNYGGFGLPFWQNLGR